MMGFFGGMIRNLSPNSWLWFQALLSLISALIVAICVQIGGVGWLIAVIGAIAITALSALSSRERAANFPPHPLMVLSMMRMAVSANTIEDFQRALVEVWSIDQTGKPSQVRVEVREAQQR